MKKILSVSILMLCLSGVAYAEQNYTIQSSGNFGQNVSSQSPKLPSTGNSGVSTLFNNVGNAFFDKKVQSSAAVGAVVSSQINSNKGNNTSNANNSGVVSPASTSTTRNNSSVRLAGRDPYLMEIDGVRYIMLKDNKDGILDRNDLLGIDDTTNSIFKSLKPLDKNSDMKLTGKELSQAGIRLVRIGADGKLLYKDKSKDFKNSDVIFVHLTELRKAYKNDGATGDFGYYDVVVKTPTGQKKLVTGVVTFETDEQIQRYF